MIRFSLETDTDYFIVFCFFSSVEASAQDYTEYEYREDDPLTSAGPPTTLKAQVIGGNPVARPPPPERPVTDFTNDLDYDEYNGKPSGKGSPGLSTAESVTDYEYEDYKDIVDSGNTNEDTSVDYDYDDDDQTGKTTNRATDKNNIGSNEMNENDYSDGTEGGASSGSSTVDDQYEDYVPGDTDPVGGSEYADDNEYYNDEQGEGIASNPGRPTDTPKRSDEGTADSDDDFYDYEKFDESLIESSGNSTDGLPKDLKGYLDDNEITTKSGADSDEPAMPTRGLATLPAYTDSGSTLMPSRDGLPEDEYEYYDDDYNNRASTESTEEFEDNYDYQGDYKDLIDDDDNGNVTEATDDLDDLFSTEAEKDDKDEEDYSDYYEEIEAFATSEANVMNSEEGGGGNTEYNYDYQEYYPEGPNEYNSTGTKTSPAVPPIAGITDRPPVGQPVPSDYEFKDYKGEKSK